MTTALIIFLILIGLLLVLVEIFVTPGIVVGLIGVILMGVGIYQAYVEYGSTIGNLVLAGTFVAAVGMVFFSLRSGAWDRLSLNDTISGKVNERDPESVKVGDQGKTISALRPSGNALINGQRFEVYTEGEAIATHQDVEVINIIGNKIIVKQIS